METSLNFAQKTNFIAGCPQIKGLEFYLQSVSLPGVNLELGNAKTFALGAYFAPSAHSFSDLSLDILIDENFEIYNSFFQNIVDTKSLVNGTYAQIEFDFYVQVYNNKGKLLFTEFFKNCMLESIGDVNLTSTDNTVVNSFSATFKFEWLEILKDGLSEEDRKKWNIYPKLKPKCYCDETCEKCKENNCSNANPKKTQNNP